MTFENEPYTVKEEGIVSVCCCCFPGDAIVKLFPDLAGAKLSHGYCPNHLALFLNQIPKAVSQK